MGQSVDHDMHHLSALANVCVSVCVCACACISTTQRLIHILFSPHSLSLSPPTQSCNQYVHIEAVNRTHNVDIESLDPGDNEQKPQLLTHPVVPFPLAHRPTKSIVCMCACASVLARKKRKEKEKNTPKRRKDSRVLNPHHRARYRDAILGARCHTFPPLGPFPSPPPSTHNKAYLVPFLPPHSQGGARCNGAKVDTGATTGCKKKNTKNPHILIPRHAGRCTAATGGHLTCKDCHHPQPPPPLSRAVGGGKGRRTRKILVLLFAAVE